MILRDLFEAYNFTMYRYAKRQKLSILFGRGVRAGMDATEQEKRAE